MVKQPGLNTCSHKPFGVLARRLKEYRPLDGAFQVSSSPGSNLTKPSAEMISFVVVSYFPISVVAIITHAEYRYKVQMLWSKIALPTMPYRKSAKPLTAVPGLSPVQRIRNILKGLWTDWRAWWGWVMTGAAEDGVSFRTYKKLYILASKGLL